MQTSLRIYINYQLTEQNKIAFIKLRNNEKNKGDKHDDG